eukprot:CAMPEP_0118710708 /NCGR_PEP_ID=MMETSP0800-20121206/23576_1 /TAXON_ID=210618 ORGANISM="Striatella unipunctata, Strain CCMP2910" /NCGR_SAMPLE_ID=MMETSP0800 /ASSEMBLY_ACC=CAM_ASM_000638 /LENGTH=162 /DNA_ID=CAMNT_0006615009 /DNA_START=17 /DNA_END=505 /DNA_ORIENTATION=-
MVRSFSIYLFLLALLDRTNVIAEDCTLDCVNGGQCQFGEAEFGFAFDEPVPFTEQTNVNQMFCSCPTGYTGIRCEIKFKVCGDNQHTCFNGAECKLGIDSTGMEYLHCDCDPAKSDLTSSYAGVFCQHAAQVFCAPGHPGAVRHTFCVNGGRCITSVNPGEE